MSAPQHEREARRWLRYAQEDLDAAETLADRWPRHGCWLAQQAAEKALKALLISRQIDFPYSHDLDRLRGLLPPGSSLHAACPDLAELTQWAVEARYPDDLPDLTRDDARRAIVQARQVIEGSTREL